MIKNYLTVVLRNLLRYKGYSAIKISGLVLGLVTSIFLSLFVATSWKFDRFHDNLDRLSMVAYHIDLATGRQIGSATQAPTAPLLKERIPGIEDYVRFVRRSHTLSFGEKNQVEHIAFADSSLLSVFTFPMEKGDPASAMRNPNSIVLTESAASRYFGDEDPTGKLMILNSAVSLEVTGVLKEIPVHSSLQFEVLVPFDVLNVVGEDTKQWGGVDYTTFLLTSPGISNADLSKRTKSVCDDIFGYDATSDNTVLHYYTLPFSRLHLYGVDGDSGVIDAVWIAVIIVLSMLIVSALNFIMLTTARIAHRNREAGIRKVMGASRSQITRQVLVETTILALLAMFISILIVELILTALASASGMSFGLESFPLEMGGLLLIWILVTGILAGIFPAISMSTAQPVSAVRGEKVTGRSGQRFRNTMVVIQFSISVVFLMLATLMHSQLQFILGKDIGLDKENVMRLPASVELQKSYDLFRRRVQENPSVLGVTTASQNIVHINSSASGAFDFDGRDRAVPIELHFDKVGYDYDKVFGLRMAQGRFYSEEIAADARGGIVLNEEAVRIMGIEDPIGKRFSYWGRDRTIIGVVENFHLEPLDETLKPLMLILEPQVNYVYLKIAPHDQAETIAAIEETYHEMIPNGYFTYSFLDDNFLSSQEKFLGLVALMDMAALMVSFIASMGLLALISFLTEVRRREISIRKTLGATTLSIMNLFLREFMKLVVISLIIGCPLAYYLGSDWLSSLPYRTDIGWGLFAITSLLAIIAMILAIGLQVMRAARANPADALRGD